MTDVEAIPVASITWAFVTDEIDVVAGKTGCSIVPSHGNTLSLETKSVYDARVHEAASGFRIECGCHNCLLAVGAVVKFYVSSRF